MSASNRLIVSILAIAALAVAFWMLLLGPKQEEASELSGQVGELRVSLSEAEVKAEAAAEARRAFPEDYRQLVVLGQAVPGGDETASLLVELNRVATSSGVKFDSLMLTGASETAEPGTAPTPETPPAEAPSGAVPASAAVSPTEVAASTMPLGATVGPAGLAVMPYTLTFSGDFFRIANFIKGIDSLVDTSDSKIAVDGRLVTLDGFALNAAAKGFPKLTASFAVTTYLTPPSQGVTAGATPTEPAPAITTPTSAAAPTSTTEATPGGDAQ